MKTYASAFRTLLVFALVIMAVMLCLFYIQRWAVSPLLYVGFTVLFLVLLADMFRNR